VTHQDTTTRIGAIISEGADNLRRLADFAPRIAEGAALLTAALKAGHTVMFCGNGGSAGDAQHMAAELSGRFLKERRPLPAVALTVNSSTITAIANDYSYDEVFSRQVEGLGRPGDVLVAISTSGNSPNVLRALESARRMNVKTLGLTGGSGGAMAALCDICIIVPSYSTPRVQEMHHVVGHILCELAEDAIA